MFRMLTLSHNFHICCCCCRCLFLCFSKTGLFAKCMQTIFYFILDFGNSPQRIQTIVGNAIQKNVRLSLGCLPWRKAKHMAISPGVNGTQPKKGFIHPHMKFIVFGFCMARMWQESPNSLSLSLTHSPLSLSLVVSDQMKWKRQQQNTIKLGNFHFSGCTHRWRNWLQERKSTAENTSALLNVNMKITLTFRLNIYRGLNEGKHGFKYLIKRHWN